GKSNDQAYNNFQENNLPYTESYNNDYKIIQKDSHTKSHKEV
ncbi:30410_t:CDS:1, partial [Gigaspora margarita]